MASKQQVESLTEEVICPICLDFFTKPVALECGHNFCRSCIRQCWESQERNCCPECREEIADRTLRVNRALANLSEKARKLNRNLKEKENKLYCEEHEEELKLFCETDMTLICLICATAREHKSHNLMPVKEAVQVYKDRVKSSFDSLTKSKADFEEMEQQQKEKISGLRKQKKTTTLKTARVGKKTRPAGRLEPQTQVHLIAGDAEQETAATATVSSREQQELHIREERGMRRREKFKLQIPATTGSESESDLEVELDFLDTTDEDEERDEEQQEKVGSGKLPADIKETMVYTMHEVKKLKARKTLKVIKEDIKNIKTVKDKLVKKEKKAEKKVKKLEERMGETTDRVNKVEDDILASTSERKQMLQKLDMLENFSRENNIKIVGLKEGIEGEDPINFFQKWIPETLEMEEETQVIEIERAQRAFRPKPQYDQNPRSILIECLRYRDKERILKAATQYTKKRRGPLMIEGKAVFFYPDISYDLLKRRKEFNPAKKVLWEKGYKFELRHPATLMIFLEDGQRSFTDYQNAEKFAQELPNTR